MFEPELTHYLDSLRIRKNVFTSFEDPLWTTLRTKNKRSHFSKPFYEFHSEPPTPGSTECFIVITSKITEWQPDTASIEDLRLFFKRLELRNVPYIEEA